MVTLTAAAPAPASRTSDDSMTDFFGAVLKIDDVVWNLNFADPSVPKLRRPWSKVQLSIFKQLQDSDEWGMTAEPPCKRCERQGMSCRIFKSVILQRVIPEWWAITVCSRCRTGRGGGTCYGLPCSFACHPDTSE